MLSYIYMGVIFLNNNNLDMQKLIQMLSKMDKNELDASIAKANQIIKNGNAQDIINNINKNK